jgi:hypothetical protein
MWGDVTEHTERRNALPTNIVSAEEVAFVLLTLVTRRMNTWGPNSLLANTLSLSHVNNRTSFLRKLGNFSRLLHYPAKEERRWVGYLIYIRRLKIDSAMQISTSTFEDNIETEFEKPGMNM